MAKATGSDGTTAPIDVRKDSVGRDNGEAVNDIAVVKPKRERRVGEKVQELRGEVRSLTAATVEKRDRAE
jgi:hypothetical protein